MKPMTEHKTSSASLRYDKMSFGHGNAFLVPGENLALPIASPISLSSVLSSLDQDSGLRINFRFLERDED